MKKLVFILMSAIAANTSCFSQLESIDLNFNPTDIGNGIGSGLNGFATEMMVQPDGKYILAGQFSAANGAAQSCIARINPDGTNDQTFQSPFGLSGLSGQLFAAALLNDGRILIGGFFSSPYGFRNFVLLNSDGTIDTNFILQQGFSGAVLDIEIQQDGKVVVISNSTTYNGVAIGRVSRLNSDLTIDLSFNSSNGFMNYVRGAEIEMDGSILVYGEPTMVNGVPSASLVRLNSSGVLDPSLNVVVDHSFGILDIALASDGSIVISGFFSAVNGVPRQRIAKLFSGGSIDFSFEVTNISGAEINDMQFDTFGRLIIAGVFIPGTGGNTTVLRRLNSDGSTDASFGFPNAPNQTMKSILPLPNNELLVSGGFYVLSGVFRKSFAKVNSDGTFDPNFNVSSAFDFPATFISSEPNGNLIVAGMFGQYFNEPASNLIRLLPNGQRDPSFYYTPIHQFLSMKSVHPTLGGKYIVNAFIPPGNLPYNLQLFRLNSNGSLDNTFIPYSFQSAQIDEVQIQSDGKILLTGMFQFVGNPEYYELVRLNADGSLDNSFVPFPTYSGGLLTKLDSQGRIVLSGTFAIGGQQLNMARLLSNGTVDNSFVQSGNFTNGVYKMAIDPNQRILACGTYNLGNGVLTTVVRYNSDGTFDTSFNHVNGNAYSFMAVECLQDGSYLFSGFFTSYLGNPREYIVRVLSDGTLASDFSSGGLNYTAEDFLQDAQGRVVVVGGFTSCFGVGKNYIVRLNNPCAPASAPLLVSSSNNNCGAIPTILSVDSGQLNGATNWQWYTDGCSITPAGFGATLNVSPAQTTTYFARGEGGCTPAGPCASITVVVNESTLYYLDSDNDGYAISTTSSCINPGTGYTTEELPLGDCNDSNAQIHPNAMEVCGNGVDDNCNGQVDEGCAPSVVVNDQFNNAPMASNSGSAYPLGNCYNGTLNGATTSPQGTASNVLPQGGQDVWYSFTALSTASRVACTTSAMNVVLELHNAQGVEVDMEDALSTASGEIMITNTLVPGQTYYVAVRSYDGTTGSFSVCIQNLMGSTCADGSGSYDLCTNFKPSYAGAQSYTTTFTPINGTTGSPTSITTTSQFALSTASLQLRHEGVYLVNIVSNFVLQDAAGNNENVSVNNNNACTITIAPHADLRTKTTQTCPATILKGTTLQAKPFVCSAINHTIEFTEVTDCTGNITVGVPFTTTTSGSSANKSLSAVGGVQAGKWYSVRWRPNFAYGNGSYGTADVIRIAGTAEEALVEPETTLKDNAMSLYPNPNKGEGFTLELEESLTSPRLTIVDMLGQVVYTEQLQTSGTTYQVTTRLAKGCYIVMIGDTKTTIQNRMIVQ